jgi:hypothetical protein
MPTPEAGGRRRMLRRSAAIVIRAVGAIHGFLAPEYLDEQMYLGALFIVAAVVCAAVAVRLWFVGGRVAWTLGALVSAGAFVGFILSRTTGLPGFREREWELIGIISLIVEGAFLALFATRERRAIARAAVSIQDAVTATTDDRRVAA